MSFRDQRHFIKVFLLILLSAFFIILGSHFLDILTQDVYDQNFDVLYFFFSIDIESVRNYIGSLAEVITGLFGIIITVVAIIVNLSANRYSSKIIDLFIKDRLNKTVLILFAIICLTGIWMSNVVQVKFNYEKLIPKYSILIYLYLISFGVLLIVPYFFYVFNFLKPDNIIEKIEKQAFIYIEQAAKHHGS